MVLKILILGKRSLKNTVCSHFPVSILRFFNHICYIKHFKDYNTKLDHAELLPLSIYQGQAFSRTDIENVCDLVMKQPKLRTDEQMIIGTRA